MSGLIDNQRRWCWRADHAFPGPKPEQTYCPLMKQFEYKVVEIREKMMGGKMSGDKLEKVLNEYGQKGWQLRSITAVEVKGRVGPGGVEGILVTFERAES